ncbi:MAG: TIGR00300 family protein [Acidobacteria bacterium RIFCSPLOWO2_02_FULL_68_18]|nr:MAG: TIGR00300 family protein [Acidobacteria bacterium RIFCSPLOWO2_02_FULL_68_18]OFW50711.1 MAG: TIGR00300 family protein [Acidobacteria bacterium RIFCSPLOWO2_12_FULL_68_19]
MAAMAASDTIEAEGHLIDSGLLSAIFDKIIEAKASYEILTFDIGRTNDDPSRIEMRVTGSDPAVLDELLQQLTTFGCHPKRERDAAVKPAEKDRCVSDDFYSTTNHRTHVRLGGRWVEVEQQRMDAVIVAAGGRAVCRKLRDVRAGDPIVCGHEGIRVTPEFKERDRLGFAFMSNDVSSERRVEGIVARIADMMRQVKDGGGRIAVVAGPVVVHTGGVEHFSEIIRRGYVDVLLAGNALAVHDIEYALSGTSLGIDLRVGAAVEQGHRNHMAAINTINRAGGVRQAVETGVLTSGVMYECVKRGVAYVLAGSIRDDGPLPDTLMDLVDAQNRYSEALTGNVQLVLMLSSMLHSIGVGNMLPSWVRVVCVDINPAVVTKLSDRGSAQTVGVVTDVGLFLHRLAERLRS